MRQTKHTAAMLIPVLMLMAACGGEPSTRAGQEAEALPARPGEDTPASTTEYPPPPSSTAGTTVAELEPDNTPAVMSRPPVSYLEETIPLCTPISGEYPCEAAPPPGTKTSGSSSIGLLPDPLPTISELVIHELTSSSAPHMVIRATGIPDTARCDGLYPVKRADFRPKDERLHRVFHYICFMDFRINEYIIGEGPPKLTMDMGGGSVSLLNPEDRDNIDEHWMKETYDLPEPEFYSLLYEGKEFIIMVGISINFSVETWTPHGYEYSMWQITREEDELRAISLAIDQADTPEQRQALNRPLNEVIREITEAVETRTTANEGRIGPDPNLPNIITDANNLQDYYKAVGQVYEGENATVLPPPAPGAEEPEQDPTQTHENQPQTNPPAPGEETPPPPPTDDDTTTTQPITEETTTTTTQPQQTEDTTPTPTEPTQPPDENTTTTTTTQPQTQDTTTTQPQTEDTTTTTTTTPTPGTTQPQTEDTIPTPTEPTQPPDDGTTTPAGTSEQPAQSE